MGTLATDDQTKIEQGDIPELIKSYDVKLTRWGLRIVRDEKEKVQFLVGEDKLRIEKDDMLVAQAVILAASLDPKRRWLTARTIRKRAEALIGLDGIGNDQIVSTMHQFKNAIYKLGYDDVHVDVGRTLDTVGNGVQERQTSIKIHDATQYTGSDIRKTLLEMGYEPEDIESFLVS